MSYMFYNCKSLQHFNTSNIKAKKVVNMNYMFYETSLTSIDLSNFDTKNTKYMDSVFEYSKYLVSVNLSSFNTKNTKSMYRMFYSCTNLTSIDLSNFNTENVVDMRYMFDYCKNLKNVDISSFTINDIKKNYDLFGNLPSNGTITLKSEYKDKIKDIPSSWTIITVD